MSTVNLTYTVVTDPDALVGFKYYVKAGDVFDAKDYARAYKLDSADLDADDVMAVRAAAAIMTHDEWLAVSHSVAA